MQQSIATGQESIPATTSAELPTTELGAASRVRTPPAAIEFTAGRCCICEQRDAEPVGVTADFEYRTSGDTFLVRRCRRCNLVYLDPRPAIDEYSRIYPPEYHAFNFSAAKFGLAYWIRVRLERHRLMRWCRDLREDARIIDVGCGDGFHFGHLSSGGEVHNLQLVAGAEVIEDRVEKKSIELSFGQRVGAFELNRILRGQYKEGCG